MLFSQKSIISSRGQYKHPIVYGLCDPDTLELRYIGKSIKGSVRCFEHCKSHSLKEGNTPKNNWLKKLKAQDKNPVFVLISEYNKNVSNESLYESEQFFIAFYKELGCSLLNLTDGGPGRSGYKLPPESLEKMSQAAKVRALPQALLDQQKKKLPEDKDGMRFCSKEKHWDKIENFGSNNFNCKSCFNKYRESRAVPGSRKKHEKTRGSKVIVLDSNNNELIGFYSKRDAARFIGGKCNKFGISLAIKNNKEYYGYYWRLI
jgi:group I intron endonuclease